MKCNLYHRLLTAVKVSKDLVYIRACLSKGVDVNRKIDREGSTLLHHADTVEIVKELILYGANINATNDAGDTPLHAAIANCKQLGVVKELLRNGAKIDVTNNEGETVLYLSVVLRDSLDVVKELLEQSTDIDIRIFERSPIVLDSSNDIDYGFMECVKLFIKNIAIKNYDCNYKEIIHLANYIESSEFSELLDYLDECIYEIVKMKRDNAVGNYSLYDLTITKHGDIKPLFHKNKIREEVISTKYPIYQDIILPNIKLCLERGFLFEKLRGLNPYIGSNSPSEEKVILHFDCMCKIARYLSSDDLLNFIVAIDKSIEQFLLSSDSHLRIRRKPVFRLDDDDIFTWCCNIQ